MTADPPGTDDTAVGSRLEALTDEAPAEHLAVYTAIAVELAARLDRADGQPTPALPSSTADHGGARG